MRGLRFISAGEGDGGEDRLNKNAEQLPLSYDYVLDGSNENGLLPACFANLVSSVPYHIPTTFITLYDTRIFNDMRFFTSMLMSFSVSFPLTCNFFYVSGVDTEVCVPAD